MCWLRTASTSWSRSSWSHELNSTNALGMATFLLQKERVVWFNCATRFSQLTNSPDVLEEPRLSATQCADCVDDEDEDVGVAGRGVDPLVKALVVVQAGRVENNDIVLQQPALVARPVDFDLRKSGR